MSLVEKAVWYIESHRGDTIELADVAAACGVSRFHLARVFQGLTGRSVMGYTRSRRLSEAARALAFGEDNILTIALDASYGSHEAFTRAFREQFEVTPTDIRAARTVQNLQLVEPFVMDASLFVDLKEPRFENRPEFRVAGLSERYTFETNQSIPALWQRLEPHLGHIPGQIGTITYGVCYNQDADCAFDYMAGVEVKGPQDLPSDFAHLSIPARRYAVFTHSGHIAEFRKTVYTIWNKWLPEADVSHDPGPDFELYDERFDGTTGEVEIWIPVH